MGLCHEPQTSRVRGQDLPQPTTVTRPSLKTPKAAAIAGVLFSVLLFTAFWLFRISVPADPLEPGAWLQADVGRVTLALNLVPFAGVAFLWFIGVLRDRLGEREDRFFATVFLGSGLLFLAMLFAAAAVIGALILSFGAAPQALINSATFQFGRGLAYGLVNIYTVKTAAVFMIATSTAVLHTDLAPRWVSFVGYVMALYIVFGAYFSDWNFVAFPAWIMLLSVCLLWNRK